MAINNKEIADQYRKQELLPMDRGGVIIFNGNVQGWVDKLRDPQSWCPGCIAVDQEGNEWVATGGNDYDGAKEWTPLAQGELEKKQGEKKSNIKKYQLVLSDAINIKLDVDTDILTCQLAEEINNEFFSGDSVLAKSNGDVVIAVVRHAATILACKLITCLNIYEAQEALNNHPLFPNDCGITLVWFDVIDIDPHDFEVKDLSKKTKPPVLNDF